MTQIKYIAHIESQASPTGNGLDFWVWCRDKYNWLIDDLHECLNRGFSTATGSCPNAKLVSVMKSVDGAFIDITSRAFRSINNKGGHDG